MSTSTKRKLNLSPGDGRSRKFTKQSDDNDNEEPSSNNNNPAASSGVTTESTPQLQPPKPKPKPPSTNDIVHDTLIFRQKLEGVQNQADVTEAVAYADLHYRTVRFFHAYPGCPPGTMVRSLVRGMNVLYSDQQQGSDLLVMLFNQQKVFSNPRNCNRLLWEAAYTHHPHKFVLDMKCGRYDGFHLEWKPEMRRRHGLICLMIRASHVPEADMLSLLNLASDAYLNAEMLWNDSIGQPVAFDETDIHHDGFGVVPVPTERVVSLSVFEAAVRWNYPKVFEYLLTRMPGVEFPAHRVPKNVDACVRSHVAAARYMTSIYQKEVSSLFLSLFLVDFAPGLPSEVLLMCLAYVFFVSPPPADAAAVPVP